MICPKCKAQVPEGPECAACGVIVEKFLARTQAESSTSASGPPSPARVSTLSAPAVSPIKSGSYSPSGHISGKLSDRKLAGAYRQLGRMLEAGLSPTESLHLMARSTKGKLAAAVKNIRSSIEQGSSFTQAAADQPVLFPEASIAILQAGESTGGLPAAFAALATSAEVRMDVRRQIIRACIYPFVLFTLVFFIPKAYLLFTLGLWAYLIACLVPYLTGLGVLISIVWLVPMLLSKLMGPRLTSRVVRSIPGLKGLFKLSSKAMFIRHLGVSLSSGLPVGPCLRLAAGATSDPAWVDAMSGVENQLQNGSTLHDALAPTGLLDDEMLLCIASGERVGRMEEALAQEASLLQGSFLHWLNISIQILSVSILLATYVFVATAVLGEYEDVMNGAKMQLDQVLKEVGGGGQGVDMNKLLKELGQPAGASSLPPELKGLLK